MIVLKIETGQMKSVIDLFVPWARTFDTCVIDNKPTFGVIFHFGETECTRF